MAENREGQSGEKLVDMAMAHFRGKALCAAVRLGIADALGDGEKSLQDLATETAVDEGALRRLMRVLTCIGVVDENAPARFVLTSFGQPLQKGAPNSVWASMVFWADLLADAWTYLPECVRAGGPSGAAEAMEREGVRSRWSMEPNASDIFHAVFAEPDVSAMAPFVTAYDFSPYALVADLGGAGGALLSAIVGANPKVRGMLVDRPEAQVRAQQRFEASGLSDRCQFVAADLLESVPPGADVYTLKSVLHGYKDEDAARILRNCRDVMTASTRLLIIENVLPTTIRKGDADVEKMVMSDLNMLLVTGGHERTEAEWASLFTSVGLKSPRVVAVFGATAGIIETTRN